MKAKQLIVLVIILLILVIALTIKSKFSSDNIETNIYDNIDIFRKEQTVKEKNKKAEEKQELKFDTAKINKIILTKGNTGEKVVLVNDGKIWKIPELWNIEADSNKINSLITHFASLKGELRSTTKEVLSDYGIADNEAFRIAFVDLNNNTYSVMLGLKSSWNNCFIRTKDSTDVYVVDGISLDAIGMAENKIDKYFWQDKHICNIDVQKINGIELKKKQEDGTTESIKLTKQQNEKGVKWSAVKAGKTFDIERQVVRRFVIGLNNFRVEKVISNTIEGYGFDNPSYQMILSFADSVDNKVITIGNSVKEGSASYYITSSDKKSFTFEAYPQTLQAFFERVK